MSLNRRGKLVNILFLMIAFLSPAIPKVHVHSVQHQTAPQAALVVEAHSTPPDEIIIPTPMEPASGNLTINLLDGVVSIETQLLNSRYVAIFYAIAGINVILLAMMKLSKFLKEEKAFESIKKIDDDHDDCISSDPLIKDYIDQTNDKNIISSGQNSPWTNLADVVSQISSFLNSYITVIPSETQEAGRLSLINCFTQTYSQLFAWSKEFGSVLPKAIITEVTGTLNDLSKLKNMVLGSSFTWEEINGIQLRLNTIVVDVDRETQTLFDK